MYVLRSLVEWHSGPHYGSTRIVSEDDASLAAFRRPDESYWLVPGTWDDAGNDD